MKAMFPLPSCGMCPIQQFGGAGRGASRGGGGGGGRSTGSTAAGIAGAAAGVGALAFGLFGGGGTSNERTEAEIEAERIRRGEIDAGGATQARGVAALESFNAEDFLGPQALQAQFEQSTRTSFLPQLRDLQGRAGRRGIRGPLAGALEGDLTSGFQRNLLAEVGRNRGQAAGFAFRRGEALTSAGGTQKAQGISLLGTELELQLARQQAQKEEKAAKRSGIGSLLGGIAGALGGFAIGGPGGAFAGAKAGATIGGSF